MNMRVLLIRPPSTFFKNTAPPIIGLPLGLLYIGAIIEKEGYNVEIFDCQIRNGEKITIINKEGQIHLGYTFEEIMRILRMKKFDLVGIGNQYSAQFSNAIMLINLIKKEFPDIPIIIGGNHVSAVPELVIEENPNIDLVIIGESEDKIGSILRCYYDKESLSGISGIAYRMNDKLILNKNYNFIENLDSVPLPAYHLIDIEKYFKLFKLGFSGRETYKYPFSEREVSMITSRGCPYNCIFCSIQNTMGKRWRAHSPEYVLNHIEFLTDKYNIKHIHFEDDNITMDLDRFEKIIDELIDKKTSITWDVPNGVRADFLNEKLLKKCKQSGCTYLRIGIESGVQETLDKIIQKKLDLKKVIEIARICKNINIDLEAFYIIGFPGEKISDMEKTINFAVKMEKKFFVFPHLFTATPLLGTRLYEVVTAQNYLVKKINSHTLATATQSEGMIETKDFRLNDIKKLREKFLKMHKSVRNKNLIKILIFNPFILLIILKRILQNPKSLKENLLQTVRYKNCLKRRINV